MIKYSKAFYLIITILLWYSLSYAQGRFRGEGAGISKSDHTIIDVNHLLHDINSRSKVIPSLEVLQYEELNWVEEQLARVNIERKWRLDTKSNIDSIDHIAGKLKLLLTDFRSYDCDSDIFLKVSSYEELVDKLNSINRYYNIEILKRPSRELVSFPPSISYLYRNNCDEFLNFVNNEKLLSLFDSYIDVLKGKKRIESNTNANIDSALLDAERSLNDYKGKLAEKMNGGDIILGSFDPENNIIAPLIVALITSVAGYFFTRFEKLKMEKKFLKKIEGAPHKYVEELDKLIKRGIEEGKPNAFVNARAIVSARNSMRNSLISISAQLNSEIDQLAIDIGETIVKLPPPSRRDVEIVNRNEAAYETIQVLARIWPSRKVQIEIEARKLLTEMGLDNNLFNK